MSKNQQSKRLYFIDPIKALYMQKEFRVKFECSYDGNKTYTKIPDDGFYITKESESIFQPKEGDEGRVLGFYCCHDGNNWIYTNKSLALSFKNSGVEIIIRDSKHFFMPEVEDD